MKPRFNIGSIVSVSLQQATSYWTTRSVKRGLRLMPSAVVDRDRSLNEVDRRRNCSNGETHVHVICTRHACQSVKSNFHYASYSK